MGLRAAAALTGLNFSHPLIEPPPPAASGGIRWQRDPAYGSPPPSRAGCACVARETAGELIVYGGWVDGSGDSDVWAFSASAGVWERRLSTAGAPPRGTAGVWVVSDRMYVFGGRATVGGAPLDDMWLYDLTLSQWTPLDAPGLQPPPRGHPVTFTPGGGKLGLWGGQGAAELFDDLWLYDTAEQQWAEVKTTGNVTPPGRSGASGAYRPADQSLYVWAGELSSGLASDALLWSLNISAANSTWAAVNTTGALPRARAHYAMVLVSSPDRLLVSGGTLHGETLGDLWAFYFSNSSWVHVVLGAQASAGLTRSLAGFAVLGDRLWLFGGAPVTAVFGVSGATLADLVSVTLTPNITFSQVHPATVTPGPRARHTAVLFGHSMWLYGGRTGIATTPLADVWSYNLETAVWTRVEPRAKAATLPSGRHSHCAVTYRGSMLVYGGVNQYEELGDLWMLEYDTAIWEKLNVAGIAPAPRGQAGTVLIDRKLYLYGGVSFGRTKMDLWVLDIEKLSWHELAPENVVARNAPGELYNFGIYGMQDGFVVVGGTTVSDTPSARVCRYNKTAQAWRVEPPLRRAVSGHVALAMSNEGASGLPRTLVIGGDTAGVTDHVARSLQLGQPGVTAPYYWYSPTRELVANGTWFGGLSGHTAVGYNGRVVVFGGWKATSSGALEVALTSSELWSMELSPLCGQGMPVTRDCWGCAPGSEFNPAVNACTICGRGAYSAGWGGRCQDCPTGTIGPHRAASALWMCEQCPAGTSQGGTGATQCDVCSPVDVCRLGSVEPQDRVDQVVQDSQPDTVHDISDSIFMATIYALVSGIVLTGLVIVAFVVSSRCTDKAARFWRRLDLVLSGSHHYPEGAFVRTLRTPHGGLMSVLVLVIFGSMAAAVIIPPAWQNEREWRAMIPLFVTPGHAPSHFTVEVRFVGFKGRCNEGALCADGVDVSAVNLSNQINKQRVRCDFEISARSAALLSGDCVVTFECPGCVISARTAQINFKVDRDDVSAASIVWKVQAESGYPGQQSTVMRQLQPLPRPTDGTLLNSSGGEGEVLKGMQPPSHAEVGVIQTQWNRYHTGEEGRGWHVYFVSHGPGRAVDTRTYPKYHGLAFSLNLQHSSGSLSVAVERFQAPVFVVAVTIGLLPGIILAMGGIMRVYERLAFADKFRGFLPELVADDGGRDGAEMREMGDDLQNSFQSDKQAIDAASAALSGTLSPSRAMLWDPQSKPSSVSRRPPALQLRDLSSSAAVGSLHDAAWRGVASPTSAPAPSEAASSPFATKSLRR